MESGLYYLNSRYYDAEVGRFINSDTIAVVEASTTPIADKNLFAYCDNNPVVREDVTGYVWETAFDVVTLGASVVEVAVNPADPWAWINLVADAVDLIPVVTGVGEVTRAIRITNKAVDTADDVIDTAKTIKRVANKADEIKTATGAYEITYKSGKNYVGKGGFGRAINSASRNATKYGDEVTSITWKMSKNSDLAFMDEYKLMSFRGVNNDYTYNRIWSPGRSKMQSLWNDLF